MAVTPRTFVRRVSWDACKSLLIWSGVDEEALGRLDAAAPPESFAEAVMREVEATDARSRDRFYAAIDQIEQLQDDLGFRALRSVALASGLARNVVDAADECRALAVMVLTRSQRDFDRAMASHYADRYRHGRSWSGYSLGAPEQVSLRLGNDARRDFEKRAQLIFSSDPLNGRCKFDWFERRMEDPATGAIHTCVQATIYLEERPRSEPRIDDAGEIAVETRRPVVEGAVLFDAKTGQVEVVAKGGRTLHERIVNLFGETMIEGADEAEPVRMRALYLSSLAGDRSFPTTPEDRVLSVEVERLSVVAPHDGLAVTLEARQRLVDEGGLHQMAKTAFGVRSPLGSDGWRVVAAALRVTFEPEKPDGRPKGVTVRLSLPNRSNLRDFTERHRLVVDRLLERWGLYAADAE